MIIMSPDYSGDIKEVPGSFLVTYGWSGDGFLMDCKIPTANRHWNKICIS